MPTELEAKLRVDSLDPVRERLHSLGATLIEKVLETNLIFDRADGTLRAAGCGLRIRTTVAEGSGDRRTILTFKGKTVPGPFKRREEIEMDVSDETAAATMLERLGFVVILRYQKRRESWSYESCRIELDEPPHLGSFVEIEGPDEQTIRSVQDKLGLGDVPHTRASYVRMLLEYGHQA